jgi:NADH:ubiquinone oxidoreductase subunit B-like Fe-S oxidoreductase
VRVVTIKHPPTAVEGFQHDNSMIGKVYDLSPQLAILMIAAGWVRSDTRTRMRRNHDQLPSSNRRHNLDRRSDA